MANLEESIINNNDNNNLNDIFESKFNNEFLNNLNNLNYNFYETYDLNDTLVNLNLNNIKDEDLEEKTIFKEIDTFLSKNSNLSIFNDLKLYEFFYVLKLIIQNKNLKNVLLNLFEGNSLIDTKDSINLNINNYYSIKFFSGEGWKTIKLKQEFPFISHKYENFAFGSNFKLSSWIILLYKGLLSILSFQHFKVENIFKLITGIPSLIIKNKEEVLKNLSLTYSSSASSNNLSVLVTVLNKNNKNILNNFNLNFDIPYIVKDFKNSENNNLIILQKQTNDNWNGAWSLKSHKWTPLNKLIFDFEDLNNDCIYMDIDDFLYLFEGIVITRFKFNQIFIGNFKEDVDGSNNNNNYPLMYKFVNRADNKNLCFSLSGKSNDFYSIEKTQIFLIIFKIESDNDLNSTDNLTIFKQKYLLNNIDFNLFIDEFPKGDYIIWAYSISGNNKYILNLLYDDVENLHLINSKMIDFYFITFDKKFQFLELKLKEIISKKYKEEQASDNNNNNNNNILQVKIKQNFNFTGLSYIFFINSTNKPYSFNCDFSHSENIKLSSKPLSNEVILKAQSEKIIVGFPTDKAFSILDINYETFISKKIPKTKSVFDLKELLEKRSELDMCEVLPIVNSNNYLNDKNNENKNNNSENDFIDTLKNNFSFLLENYKALINFNNDEHFLADKDLEDQKLILTLALKKNIFVIDLKFKNGDSYYGQLDFKGQKTGKGLYLWATGEKFLGYFIKNKRTYKGFQYNINNTLIYEGYLFNGARQNFGRLILKNNDIYTGYFKSNLFNGKGEYWYFKDNSILKGNFKNGKAIGNCVYVTKDDGQESTKYFK